MPRWQRVYLSLCAGIVGYCASYALSVFGQWPKLTYFPYERTWEVVAVPPGPVPSNYVGIVLWGVGGGVVLAAVVMTVCRWLPELPTRWLHLAGAWALTAFVLAGLFFTWNLWPF